MAIMRVRHAPPYNGAHPGHAVRDAGASDTRGRRGSGTPASMRLDPVDGEGDPLPIHQNHEMLAMPSLRQAAARLHRSRRPSLCHEFCVRVFPLTHVIGPHASRGPTVDSHSRGPSAPRRRSIRRRPRTRRTSATQARRLQPLSAPIRQGHCPGRRWPPATLPCTCRVAFGGVSRVAWYRSRRRWRQAPVDPAARGRDTPLAWLPCLCDLPTRATSPRDRSSTESWRRTLSRMEVDRGLPGSSGGSLSAAGCRQHRTLFRHGPHGFQLPSHPR